MIDHLVLATPGIEATVDELEARWGVALTAGGSHVGRGTRNELAGLGGTTYLEVVGADHDQPDPPFARPFGVDDLHAARLVAWCARPTRPLSTVLSAVAALGIDLGAIAEMSRARPDGVLLRWQLTFPMLDAPHHGTMPFLIDWLDSPHPTESLTHEATVTKLQLVHPQADLLRAVLSEVGRSDVVEVSTGTAHLSAEIRTPRGTVSL